MRDVRKKWFILSVVLASFFLFESSAFSHGDEMLVFMGLLVLICGGWFGIVLTSFGFHGLLAVTLGTLISVSGVVVYLLTGDGRPVFSVKENPPSSSSSREPAHSKLKMNIS